MLGFPGFPHALVAQLAEHIHGKDKVNGSIPFEGSLSIGFMDRPSKTGTAPPNPFEGSNRIDRGIHRGARRFGGFSFDKVKGWGL